VSKIGDDAVFDTLVSRQYGNTWEEAMQIQICALTAPIDLSIKKKII
jgi:hypothetical protein